MMANKTTPFVMLMGCAEPFEVSFFLILTDWYTGELPRCVDIKIYRCDNDRQQQIRTIPLLHAYESRIYSYGFYPSEHSYDNTIEMSNSHQLLKYCWSMTPHPSYDYQYWYPSGKHQHEHKNLYYRHNGHQLKAYIHISTCTHIHAYTTSNTNSPRTQ